ncbi:hypothetical protein K469DRAFT_23454 [Zopfia rhizophila CBS 207.26]|uniref:Uncharacterized protein n=1 Tax=Zopfia rhizophila CBS 207.26 TaxID=1314779 RepID=A0A6A6EF02_9PEZI|nr:hypothetical protein K469DRAFT_23454 [Zopfia rhizophila CBS 207.26]
MTFLHGPLQKTPIDAQTRSEIINNLWSQKPSLQLQQGDLDWDSYFTYYTKQCNHALYDRGRHISSRTHHDVVDIAQQLEDLSSKDVIKQNLRSNLTSPNLPNENELLESSIDLASRLLLMMDIGVVQYGFSGRRQLVWSTGSLRDFLNGYFSQSQVLGHDNVKLERMFTARNLGRIAGIQIEWTDNLADHLRIIDDEDKRVAIFHHASFLKWQNSKLFPDGLIEETLRSLALLFPQSDKHTQKWFNKLPYSLHLDSKVIKCGQLRVDDRQIEKFKFWHDRLVILKQVFDQSRPATLSQWWYDRRNGVQWYTFWVAILVLFLTTFFGMVQSIEGALQVHKAYHPTPL